jgi:hypothetical protein
MWVFTDDGFISIVEFSPPRWKTVKPAKYKTISQAEYKYDPELKKSVKIKDAVTEKIEDEVKEQFSDPFEKQLSELGTYVPASYDSKGPDGETIPGVACSHLLVRARVEDDLEQLKAYDPDHIAWEDKTADYQFRLILLRTALAQYVYDKTMAVDYSSHVKETIDRRAPKVKGGRYSALSKIWSACSDWQPLPPYGGGYTISGNGWRTSETSSYVSPYGSTDAYGGSYSGSTGIGGYWKKDDPALPKAARGENAVLAGLTEANDDDLLGKALAQIDGITDTSDDDLNWWEYALSTGDPTRETMEAQLSDLLRAIGEMSDYDLMNSVDAIQSKFGTVNLDSLEPDDLYDTLETTKLSNSVI